MNNKLKNVWEKEIKTVDHNGASNCITLSSKDGLKWNQY